MKFFNSNSASIFSLTLLNYSLLFPISNGKFVDYVSKSNFHPEQNNKADHQIYNTNHDRFGYKNRKPRRNRKRRQNENDILSTDNLTNLSVNPEDVSNDDDARVSGPENCENTDLLTPNQYKYYLLDSTGEGNNIKVLDEEYSWHQDNSNVHKKVRFQIKSSDEALMLFCRDINTVNMFNIAGKSWTWSEHSSETSNCIELRIGAAPNQSKLYLYTLGNFQNKPGDNLERDFTFEQENLINPNLWSYYEISWLNGIFKIEKTSPAEEAFTWEIPNIIDTNDSFPEISVSSSNSATVNWSVNCLKNCFCVDGTSKIEEQCSQDGNHECGSCDENYGLNQEELCQEITCACENGVLDENEIFNCGEDNLGVCKDCNEFYHLNSTTTRCEENVCRCGKGTPVSNENCPKNNQWVGFGR